ncbi:MAG: RNA polymerase sigma factor [Planctomycetota bacterium]|jgi:RNA polymerase sigma-70 factor (ECF subfamily)
MTSSSPGQNNFGYRVAAAAKMFHDYGDFIKKVICSQVQDDNQAEDVCQDFFLSLVSYPVPQHVQNVKAYLYKAITNDIIDATRRTAKYRACMCKYAELCNRPVAQKTPEEILLEIEETSKLFELIEKQLPRAEAEAVSLQYRNSYDVKEIAEAMGVANATARAYISDALDTLRRLLGSMEAGVME